MLLGDEDSATEDLTPEAQESYRDWIGYQKIAAEEAERQGLLRAEMEARERQRVLDRLAAEAKAKQEELEATLAVMIPVDPQAGDEVERWYELEKKAEAKAPARRPTRAKTTPRRDPTPEPEKKSEPQVDLLQDGPKAKVGIIGN